MNILPRNPYLSLSGIILWCIVSCLKVVGGGWVAYSILVSVPGPFGTNWVLELIGTLLGLGLGGFGTKDLWPGLVPVDYKSGLNFLRPV